MSTSQDLVHCACVIHGSAYDWTYVDKLYSMLCRNLTRPVKLHVWTESDRPVPAHMVKHELEDWGIGGPKKSWWYKMQMFNSTHYQGMLLYFDLDVVIVDNLDWILDCNRRYFWSVRDFKYLWRPTDISINSSIMYWDTVKYHWIWHGFNQTGVVANTRRFRGDQDYLSSCISPQQRRMFDIDRVKSWRWQCLDGGYDFKKRAWNTPGTGTTVEKTTSVLVLHGDPKPAKITDLVIQHYWR